MDSLGKRIKSLRAHGSQKYFAKMIGVHPNTLGRWERDEQSPTHEELLLIFKELPGVNPIWLILGEGPIFRDDLIPRDQAVHAENYSSQKEDESSFDFIPMVEAELSAGGGAFVQSEDVKGYYAFRKDWLRRVASGPKDMVLMRVIGDSMAPTIQENDTVMVDTGRKQIREGCIYAIRFDHTIMIKRLSFRPGGKVQIISDNREYQPYEADIKDINIIGQVIFFSRVLIQE